MVIDRRSGSSVSVGWPLSSSLSMPTLASAKAGMYFSMGSSSLSLPSSTSIMIATLVIGFDIEYSRKIVSDVIGCWLTTSRTPKHSE